MASLDIFVASAIDVGGSVPDPVVPSVISKERKGKEVVMGGQDCNNQVPTQAVGEIFKLMPGEKLLKAGSMQRVIFPAGNTFMRLTDRRLVFCHISRGLTLFVSWLFMFQRASRISQTFTREDIASMELKSSLGHKTLVIQDNSGEVSKFTGAWFSNGLVNSIMDWWKSGK